MGLGRTVPWCSWEEWCMVRDWLLSDSHDNVAKGIQRVETWRARGRLPLSVDITASLLETALSDSSFWDAPAANAAAAARPAGTGPGQLSQQQIRLQYSATIVRFVNGIADSQQKGRVAMSVASLAGAAGLSRLLVDLRHEATHNELPSLPALQLAVRQALDWLVAQYWQRQADHLQACKARVVDLLSVLGASCQAAAAAAFKPAGTDQDDQQVEDSVGSDEQQASKAGYSAAEGRKQRKQLLAELKGLLPPSHTHLLVRLMLQQHTMMLLSPSASSTTTESRTAQETQQLQQQQQQHQDRNQTKGPYKLEPPGSQVRQAQELALKSLAKHYPELKLQLLQEAVSRLCGLSRQQQEDPAAEACKLLAWVQLLLPLLPAAEGASSSTLGGSSSKAAKVSSSRQRQQQQATERPEHQKGSTHVLRQLAQLIVQVSECLLEIKPTKLSTAAATTANVTSNGPYSLHEALLQMRQLLLAAVADRNSSYRNSQLALLVRLSQLAVPAASTATKQQPQNMQTQQVQMQRSSWQQEQLAHLQHAKEQQAACLQEPTAQQQQQQRGRKRPAQADLSSTTSSANKRWKRVSSWAPCAIGCLPEVRQPEQLLDILQAPCTPDEDYDINGSGNHTAEVRAGCGSATAVPAGLQPTAAAGAAAAEMAADGVVSVDTLEAEQQHIEAQAAGVPDAAAQPAAGTGEIAGTGDDHAAAAGASDVVRFGQFWQLKRQQLEQLRMTVRLLL